MSGMELGHDESAPEMPTDARRTFSEVEVTSMIRTAQEDIVRRTVMLDQSQDLQ
ncbi:hypothetical protein M404DRAFT_35127 [Pisolithus tinctorius Marx 270]|uniref:Uncharacterized protein n=1 Tax=Pisolithus tinctorius Marx 270 TaxID=870435 RepID=A0A0C3MZW5_PISTI|nr:hypothetical protein M404DRAFT_35127 [Pisolithus tinctorius Marx 270]